LKLLNKLPDDCSLEDIQYHLYVIEKLRKGLKAADSQSSVPQEEVEQRLGKWLTEVAWYPRAIENLAAIAQYISEVDSVA
jgi:hypothetical protein